MHIEDEVIDAMLKAAEWPYSHTDRDRMRAAADVLTPVLLAMALAEPSDAEIRRTDGPLWEADDYARVKIIFANRLRSLQAKPDPRVAMIMEELRECDIDTDDRTFTERILAALDEYARKDAK